ncbi:hypothetical protein F6Q07_22100 [Pectobacterium parmentieri]|uniref:hypothetical protein n=1 Tax=Pectobacterium parmentieri TaxID=1905730 RepID=UPI0018DF02B4|nr:hypothetical protein [Pectobacterium parmentieri]MBI0520772.1 hypothetical protein [Pectobacterium parmentieri]
MKQFSIIAAKCVAFVFFMTVLGLSSGDGFSRDSRGFSFFCLSILIIIVWMELKKTLLSALGK